MNLVVMNQTLDIVLFDLSSSRMEKGMTDLVFASGVEWRFGHS
jgi:hypothetical protein